MNSTPKCPHFNSCGGCSLQHIHYELTLVNKKAYVTNQLKKFDIIVPEQVEIKHTAEYNYRNRMDFVFFDLGLGLRQKDQFDKIIKINNCAIASEKINILKLEIEEWFNKIKVEPFNLRTKKGTMKYALIRACEFNDDSCISFALSSESAQLATHIDLIKDFAKKTTAKNVMIARIPSNHDASTSDDYFCIKGTQYLEENFLGKKMKYHSEGFFQNNPTTASLMVQKAGDILSNYDTTNSNLLDLYGGIGTFGVCLADKFKKTIIIESVKDSIDCAKMNILSNNISNAEAHVLDSAKMIKVVSKGNLFCITDPPRSGMTRQAIENLLSLEPEVIIYISCNPQQFAKEMIVFKKKYDMKSLTIFDMFPQTNHIESMAELVIRKEAIK
jgi:23S rRNA (uracil1939-C5)-methyltransferase